MNEIIRNVVIKTRVEVDEKSSGEAEKQANRSLGIEKKQTKAAEDTNRVLRNRIKLLARSQQQELKNIAAVAQMRLDMYARQEREEKKRIKQIEAEKRAHERAKKDYLRGLKQVEAERVRQEKAEYRRIANEVQFRLDMERNTARNRANIEKQQRAQRVESVREFKLGGQSSRLVEAAGLGASQAELRFLQAIRKSRSDILRAAKNQQDLTVQQMRSLAWIEKKEREILGLKRQQNASGGRGGGSAKGGGAGGQNQFWSTGNRFIDRANELGFQMMITKFTLMMIPEISRAVMKSFDSVGNAALSIRREGFLSASLGGLFGSDRDEDSIASHGLRARRGVRRLFGMREEAPLQYERDQQWQQIRIRPQVSEFERMDTQRDQLRGLVDLWDQVHGKARAAAQQELEASEKRLQNAQREFGLMDAADQMSVVDIGRRLASGQRTSTDELQLLRSVVGNDNEVLKDRTMERSNLGGFGELERLFRFSQEVEQNKAKAEALAPKIEINGVTVNVETAIEDLSKNLSDKIEAEIKRRYLEAGLGQMVLGNKDARTSPQFDF